MNKMLVAVFDRESTAFEGLSALKDLHRIGDISLYSSAVIAMDSAGKVELKQAADPGPVGTALGLLTGSVIGILGGPAGHRWVRRQSRRHLVDRHGHPQLGDPDRSDRDRNRRGPRAMGCGDRGYRASAAPDPPHRGSRHSGHDPDRADRVLGADGLRSDRRPCSGDVVDPCLPAGAVCRMVSNTGQPLVGPDNPSRHSGGRPRLSEAGKLRPLRPAPGQPATGLPARRLRHPVSGSAMANARGSIFVPS